MSLEINTKRFMAAVGRVVPVDFLKRESENSYTFQDEVDDAIGVFGLRIVLLEEEIKVFTCCWLRVDQENIQPVKSLFETINSKLERGQFAISKDNTLFFWMKTNYHEIESLENPLDLILQGVTVFNKYHKAIFSALGMNSGEQVKNP